MNTDHLYFVMVFTVPDDKFGRFKEVTAEQRRISETEEGTLVYETYRHKDGTFCHIERYADEAALIAHVQNTAPQLQEWMTIVELTNTIAMGTISDATVQKFALEQHYLPYAQM